MTPTTSAAKSPDQKASYRSRLTRALWFRNPERPNRFLFAAVFDDTDAERLHRASPPAMRLAALLLSVGVRIEPSGWEPVAGL